MFFHCLDFTSSIDFTKPRGASKNKFLSYYPDNFNTSRKLRTLPSDYIWPEGLGQEDESFIVNIQATLALDFTPSSSMAMWKIYVKDTTKYGSQKTKLIKFVGKDFELGIYIQSRKISVEDIASGGTPAFSFSGEPADCNDDGSNENSCFFTFALFESAEFSFLTINGHIFYFSNDQYAFGFYESSTFQLGIMQEDNNVFAQGMMDRYGGFVSIKDSKLEYFAANFTSLDTFQPVLFSEFAPQNWDWNWQLPSSLTEYIEVQNKRHPVQNDLALFFGFQRRLNVPEVRLMLHEFSALQLRVFGNLRFPHSMQRTRFP